MSALGIDIDLTTDHLEDHWGDEAKCTTRGHRTNCSVAVVARVIAKCGAPSTLWCANRVQDYLTMAPRGALCSDCFTPISVCFAVIPV